MRKNNLLLLGIIGLFTILHIPYAIAKQLTVRKLDRDKDGWADSILVEHDKGYAVAGIKDKQIHKLEVWHTQASQHTSLVYVKSGEKFVLSYAQSNENHTFYGESCTGLTNPPDKYFDEVLTFFQREFGIGKQTTCKDINSSDQKIKNVLENEFQPYLSCYSLSDHTPHLRFEFLINDEGKMDLLQDLCIEQNTSKCTGSYESTNPNKPKITISSSCLDNRESLKNILLHEILHASGIQDHKTISCIEKYCNPDNTTNDNDLSSCIAIKSNGFDQLKEEVLLPTAVPTTAITVDSGTRMQTLTETQGGFGTTAPAQAAISDNKQVYVPSTIATSQVPRPRPTELRMPAGSSYQREIVSTSDSSSLPAQIANLAASTIPQADARQSLANSSSNRNINRRAASTGSGIAKPQLAPLNLNAPTLETRAPASSIENTANINAPKNNLADAAQSIEQTNNKQATVPTRRATASNSPEPAQAQQRSSSSANTSTAQNNNSRNVASSSRTSGSTLSRSEVIQIFRTENHSEVRQRLNDPAFQESLRINNITVLNTRGQSWGADEQSADTVFSDTGNRFIPSQRSPGSR